MVAGLLLARGGVEVTVLEKHPDFLRDFRGDTVHPPTLDLLDDLGLSEEFAALPAGRMTGMEARIGSREVLLGDLAHSPGRHKSFVMVPQWDLLELLARTAEREPTFSLLLSTEVTGLTRDSSDRVDGVTVRDVSGERRIAADLVIDCDGRWSAVRAAAGLILDEVDLPMDVWWMRVPLGADERVDRIRAVFVDGQVAVSAVRHGYHQVACMIPRGSDPERRVGDVGRVRADLADHFGWDTEQVAAISSWDDVRLLRTTAGILRRWWAPGVLCIGDAAHPMSPVMGVGVNLAIQDAVAAARLLAPHLRQGTLEDEHLAQVEKRRRRSTRIVQAMQDTEHDHLIRPALDHDINRRRLPLPIRIMQASPVLSGLAAWAQSCLLGREPTPDWARRRQS